MQKTKFFTMLLSAAILYVLTGCNNISNYYYTGNTGSNSEGGSVTEDVTWPEGVIPLKTGTNGTAGTSGTYVYFGEWPQTLKDADLKIYTNYTKTVGMFTYYLGNDSEWYAEVKGNYYKVEPIKWRVLNPDAKGTEKKILFAENALIASSYYDTFVNGTEITINGEEIGHNNYEHSRVRALLNGLSYWIKADKNAEQEEITEFKDKGFLHTAFTQEEIAAIADTSVVNDARSTNPDDNPYYDNDGENSYASDTPTIDKVFLLSIQEVTKQEYGFTYSPVRDYETKALGERNARIRNSTDFAAANGAKNINISSGNFGCQWWLRSPYVYGDYEQKTVDYDGYAGRLSYVDNNYGVVPALCLN
ncbi:MAG: DUF6273 domain-containing protein [Treponema sp.]|nr:DUF6273 domain-containing protein [Treponema sp.]